jgi:4-hydroxybenzoate polyprenyltransferase
MARSGRAKARPRVRTAARAALEALRPAQWTKNLLIFSGIVFAAELGDARRWLYASLAFIAYCAASSAAYLANDVRDAEVDRHHPVKRRRPVARGDLSARAALSLSAALLAFAVTVGTVLGMRSLLLLAAFVTVQAAYTLRLKYIVLIDVFAIACLFVLRAVAGAVAIDVRTSEWLLICTALLALFLALGKRRAELALVTAGETPGRSVLSGYSPQLIDQLVSVTAASAMIAYSLYTFTARDSQLMMLTIPFVVYGLFRYLMLIDRSGDGEEPERVLVRDRPLAVAVAMWAVAAATILSVT